MSEFKKKFFAGNRDRLMDSLPGAVVFVPAHNLLQSSADLSFPFRQDSNFWYLCGLDQPDAVLVIDTSMRTSTLLLPERSDFHDEWDGAYDTGAMHRSSGVDKLEIVKMEPKIAKIVSGAVKNGMKIGYLEPLNELVQPYGFYSNPARRNLHKQLKGLLEARPLAKGRRKEEMLVDVRLDIARLRQVKQPVEIEAIKQAINHTATALADVKDRVESFETEKDIQRAISAHFYGTADGHAYEPIIATGKNAATIHYIDDNQPIKQGDLLLLDVGALSGKYGADISRTWSVGRPTRRQTDLHAAIIDVQQYAKSLLKPGVMLREYQKQVESYHTKIMSSHGITERVYPHGVSHFLGLDTHDAGDYAAPLVENAVMTVEPGIYLPEEGIGIRIEDNVRITADGIESLSADIPTGL